MISSISREEIGTSKSPAGHPAVFDYGPVRPASVVIAIARSSRRGAAGFRLVQIGRTSRNGFDSPARPPYFRGMPPRRPKPKDTPAKLAARMSRRWRIILLRGKGQLLGEVEAPDEKAAEAAAAAQFELNDEQRKQVAVQAMD
jgi:hypothetical protein